MPNHTDPTSNPEALAASLAAATTASDTWDVMLAWRKGMYSATAVAANSIKVWDPGLARLVVLDNGHQSAILNPSWGSAETDVVARGAYQMLTTERAANETRRATRILCGMAEHGLITNDSPVVQQLLALLKGKPHLKFSERRAASVLLAVKDLSLEAYEHVFTCLRRGNLLADYMMTDDTGLLTHPGTTVAHWTIAMAATRDDEWIGAAISIPDARRNPAIRGLILSALARQATNPWISGRLLWSFIRDEEANLTIEELEELYNLCGGEKACACLRQTSKWREDDDTTLTPAARIFLSRHGLERAGMPPETPAETPPEYHGQLRPAIAR